jgi:hypothetical protein
MDCRFPRAAFTPPPEADDEGASGAQAHFQKPQTASRGFDKDLWSGQSLSLQLVKVEPVQNGKRVLDFRVRLLDKNGKVIASNVVSRQYAKDKPAKLPIRLDAAFGPWPSVKDFQNGDLHVTVSKAANGKIMLSYSRGTCTSMTRTFPGPETVRCEPYELKFVGSEKEAQILLNGWSAAMAEKKSAPESAPSEPSEADQGVTNAR